MYLDSMIQAFENGLHDLKWPFVRECKRAFYENHSSWKSKSKRTCKNFTILAKKSEPEWKVIATIARVCICVTDNEFSDELLHE